MSMKTSVVLILLISIALILIYQSFQVEDEGEGVERAIFETGMVNIKIHNMTIKWYEFET